MVQQIFVRSLTRTLALDVDTSTTIANIKQMITDKEGYHFNHKSLQYIGRPLYDDDKTLSSYGIENDSTLHVGFSLLSCKESCCKICSSQQELDLDLDIPFIKEFLVGPDKLPIYDVNQSA